jgi:hypothetical protein
MFTLAMIAFVVILFGGVARLLLTVTKRVELLPIPERSVKKQKLRMVGVANIIGATFGIYFLVARSGPPLDILIGVVLVTSLVEIAIRNKSVGKQSNWSG